MFPGRESEWSKWRKLFDHEVIEVISMHHPSWLLIPYGYLEGKLIIQILKTERLNLRKEAERLHICSHFLRCFFKSIMDLSPWVRLGYVHDIYQNLSNTRPSRVTSWQVSLKKDDCSWYPEFVTGVVAREPEFELIQRFFLCYLQPFGGRYICILYIYVYLYVYYIYMYICIYIYIYIYTYESTNQRCLNGRWFSLLFF